MTREASRQAVILWLLLCAFGACGCSSALSVTGDALAEYHDQVSAVYDDALGDCVELDVAEAEECFGEVDDRFQARWDAYNAAHAAWWAWALAVNGGADDETVAQLAQAATEAFARLVEVASELPR